MESVQPVADGSGLWQKKLSFAQSLLASLRPTKVTLQVKPPVFTDAGAPVVFFSHDEISKSEEALKRAIIVKCSYGRPSISDIKLCLTFRLGLKSDFIVSSLNHRHLLLRFESVCIDLDIAAPLQEKIWIGKVDQGFWQKKHKSNLPKKPDVHGAPASPSAPTVNEWRPVHGRKSKSLAVASEVPISNAFERLREGFLDSVVDAQDNNVTEQVGPIDEDNAHVLGTQDNGEEVIVNQLLDPARNHAWAVMEFPTVLLSKTMNHALVVMEILMFLSHQFLVVRSLECLAAEVRAMHDGVLLAVEKGLTVTDIYLDYLTLVSSRHSSIAPAWDCSSPVPAFLLILGTGWVLGILGILDVWSSQRSGNALEIFAPCYGNHSPTRLKASSGILQRLEESLNIGEDFNDTYLRSASIQNSDRGSFEGYLAQAEEGFFDPNHRLRNFLKASTLFTSFLHTSSRIWLRVVGVVFLLVRVSRGEMSLGVRIKVSSKPQHPRVLCFLHRHQ
ncbi:hypothetical protein Taro_014367 [Colocasia esculenta]|uniref:Uncharacterized protein n=1 Tax=Colocasia esculenta TaxID=4460 RepID=A0A843UEB5_COLES|nr:hypothetical protein [Colocasia esculenta]